MPKQQNRDAQAASLQQQRGIMDYIRGLNEWLRQDIDDRRNELRGVSARVDQVLDDLHNMTVTGKHFLAVDIVCHS